MNNQYNTAGVDYPARDAAMKTEAMRAVTGGLLDSGASGSITRDTTPAERLIAELEFICDVLRDTYQLQQSFATRLYGPRPEEGGQNVKSNPPDTGALGAINDRAQWAREWALRVREQQYAIGQVA